MSTQETLNDLVSQGHLIEFRVTPPYPDMIRRRRVMMTEEAFQWCPPPPAERSPHFSDDQLALARATLVDFIFLPRLEEGFHARQLDPFESEVWEIRAVGSPRRKQSRLFGWFAWPGVFIGIHWKLRSQLEKRWAGAIQKVVRKRDNKFANLPILSGGDFQLYVTHQGELEQ